MMQLSVRLVPVNETTLVIALTGELDSTTRPVLSAFLDPLPKSPVKYVLVAAGDLWFCDLTGLEQLSITHRALQAKDGHLAVAEAQPPLRRLIALTSEQVQTALPVFGSMAEALANAGVDGYQTPASDTPGRRHLPRMRPMPRGQVVVRDRLKPRPQPSPGETEQRVELEIGSLQSIIRQSRALRERIALQHEVLVQERASTTKARESLLMVRQRTDDSRRAMRDSLFNVRAVIGLDGHLSGPPFPP
jgi:anti-anti-sigma factor